MQIVSIWDNLHEMSNLVFLVKEKIQYVICWSFLPRVPEFTQSLGSFNENSMWMKVKYVKDD